MRPALQPLLRVSKIASIGFLCALACTGEAFRAGVPGIAGASGAAGAGAGAGGGASSAGAASAGRPGGGENAGAAGDGGQAGAPARECSCAAGDYCKANTTICESCRDFSTLSFGKAQKLSTLNRTAESQERFPRVGANGGELFYRLQNGAASEIWHTSNPLSGFGARVELGDALYSGPLWVPGVFEGYDFFFDVSTAPDARRLQRAHWDGKGVSNIADLPTPLDGSFEYDLTIAAQTKRAFWMSNRKIAGNDTSAIKLLTASLAPGNEDAPSELTIELSIGASQCERSGDATPWVTPDGTLLLFRNATLDETCAQSDEGATDIYAVTLNPNTGLPTATAKPLSTINVSSGKSSETDPSLSPDACTLYFASNTGDAERYDIYRAERN